MKIKEKIGVGLLAFLLTTQTAYGVSQQELINKSNQNRENLRQTESNIESYQIQAQDVMQELQDLDGEIADFTRDIDAIELQISQLRQKISDSKREMEDVNKNLKEKRELFAQRLQAMYMSGKTNYLELIFSSRNVTDLLSKTRLISNLVEHDTTLIDDLENYENEVRTRQTELDNSKKSLDKLVDSLAETKKDLEQKQKDKDALLEEIHSNLEYAQSVRDNLLQQQEAIDAQIRAAAEERERQAAANGESVEHIDVSAVGQLAWPLPASSNVTSEFGGRNSPFAEIGNFHTGLDIAAAPGTPIVAARAGTVVYAGWGGYGVMVIIDHGGGLYTLYGHGTDGSIRISNGQQVSAGDVIMGVGSTGYSTGPHLHFEVRVGGNSMNNAVNPRNFL